MIPSRGKSIDYLFLVLVTIHFSGLVGLAGRMVSGCTEGLYKE
jgi:hypothetical protein